MSPGRPARIARAYLPSPCSFDRWHYHYARSKLATDPLFDGVVDALAGDSHPLLDVGCGMGLLALVLQDAGHAAGYLGVDFDEKKIARARAAAQRFGAEDARFDTVDLMQLFPAHHGSVTILDVLQYLPIEVQTRVLDSAIAALAPGGRLVIRTGLADASRRSKVTGWADHVGNLSGWMRSAPKAYPEREVLDQHLKSAGLDVTWAPLRGHTPFNNWLVLGEKSRNE